VLMVEIDLPRAQGSFFQTFWYLTAYSS
jgi:hypothetical protein